MARNSSRPPLSRIRSRLYPCIVSRCTVPCIRYTYTCIILYVNLTCIIYCTVQYHAVRPLVSCSMYRTVSYTLQYSIIYQVYSYHWLKGPRHKIFKNLFCFKKFNLLSHTNMQKRFRELFCFHEDILSQKMLKIL